MHVSFHQISDDVDVFIACLSWWPCNLKEIDNIFVVEELQKFDLSYDTFGINQVFKCLWNLLDGDFYFAFVIISTADYTVRAVPNLLYVFKLLFDTECSSYQL